jgi:bacillithiol biosynthesis cysteine-adding enzyme BshC
MLNLAGFPVPFEKTESYDKLIIDYLKNDEFLIKFFDFDDSPEGIKLRIDTYQNPRLDRELLKNTLINQYAQSGIQEVSEKVKKNLQSLSFHNTFTITTGHQLNILGGPLYVLYKIITVINTSEQLSKLFPDYNFVPVFWMATEDHDIEEISSLSLFGKKYKWESSWNGLSGKMPTKGLEILINEITQTFGNTVFGEKLDQIIKDSYLSSLTLAEATRKWVDAFMGMYGLIIVDGNEPALKRRIKDIIEEEILHQSSSKIINNTILSLEEKYHVQARPREINLFYTGDDFRERIVKDGENVKVLNKDIVFTHESIVQEIEKSTERFSPNVLLRPLYQESVLPNIAYIGGPAEVAYWLELKDVFNHFKVPMPVVLLRSCAAILEKNILDKIEKYSISDKDLFLPADDWIRKFIENKKEDHFPIEKVSLQISGEFEMLGAQISKMDPSLSPFIEAENVIFNTKRKSNTLSKKEK